MSTTITVTRKSAPGSVPLGLRNVHSEADCIGACSIHAPSDHHMRSWPLSWRGDRGLMERICPHGIGHPDPDHLAHSERLRGKDFADAESVHGCDGCCRASDDRTEG